MSQDDGAAEVTRDLPALKSKLMELMEASGLTAPAIEEGWGIGTDTIGRIIQLRAKDVNRSTLSLLSLIFRKRRDYLENVYYGRPAIEEPELTLELLRDEIRGVLDSMRTEVRGELRRQGDILREIAPVVLGVEYRPVEHAARDDAGVPARGKEPGEHPLT